MPDSAREVLENYLSGKCEKNDANANDVDKCKTNELNAILQKRISERGECPYSDSQKEDASS